MTRLLSVLLAALALLSARAVLAEPYLAVQQGYPCGTCHVNPTGGGLRNDFGTVFAENAMAMAPLPEGVPVWSGRLGDFVRLGGDLRASWSRSEVPGSPAQHATGVDQLRVYAAAEVIPERLGLYVDEALAPGDARVQEAYARLSFPASGAYLKAGQFYLPFGWRLQDNTAFVREVSGIGMTTPDSGVELGLVRGPWSAQLDVTNGAANAGSGAGHQLTAQAVRTLPGWRVGLAATHTDSPAGNRDVAGLFAGLRTGRVAWLGEADLVRDAGFPEGSRNLLALLGEADWRVVQGQNLKLTYEYYDPDRSVAQDQQTRWSLLYEVTPLPFVQLRAGFRRYRGIPQSDLENRRFAFLELHGFF
jgi:hypothetical protein